MVDFGAAGESAEQAKAVIIAEAASAKVVSERRRIVAILLGFEQTVLRSSPSKAVPMPAAQVVQS